MSIDYEKLKISPLKPLQIIHICPLSLIFGQKIANFGYRIVYSIPTLRSFKGVFQGGFNGDLAAKIERASGSFKRTFPPSTSGCPRRDPAVARMPGTARPFLYILISRARASSLLRSSRAKKNAAPKGGVPIAFHSAQKFCSSG